MTEIQTLGIGTGKGLNHAAILFQHTDSVKQNSAIHSGRTYSVVLKEILIYSSSLAEENTATAAQAANSAIQLEKLASDMRATVGKFRL